MPRCEGCGHGPGSTGGDGGGCPDSEGRFNCVSCGKKMKRGATSAICGMCRRPRDFDMTGQDQEAEFGAFL